MISIAQHSSYHVAFYLLIDLLLKDFHIAFVINYKVIKNDNQIEEARIITRIAPEKLLMLDCLNLHSIDNLITQNLKCCRGTNITVQYITSHYIKFYTLHYITSHYIKFYTLHYITSHYIKLYTLHYITQNYMTVLHYSKLPLYYYINVKLILWHLQMVRSTT
jgi:hypothetical protein